MIPGDPQPATADEKIPVWPEVRQLHVVATFGGATIPPAVSDSDEGVVGARVGPLLQLDIVNPSAAAAPNNWQTLCNAARSLMTILPRRTV